MYESRPACEPAVRLLVASLFAAVPDARVRLHVATESDTFAAWAAQFPGLEVRPADLDASLGWNIKPIVLLAALADGARQVLWLDSDILVARDFRPLFATAGDGTLWATEEARWGTPDDRNAARARSWGFPVGRTLPTALNSCVVRVDQSHRALLEAWCAVMAGPVYREAQEQFWGTRPIHLMGDQDVLTALLCAAEFAATPLRVLRRGHGILQLFGPTGFTLKERAIVARHGLPPFLHSQGTKPWLSPGAGIAGLYADSSPYMIEATRFADALDDPGWLMAGSRGRSVMRGVGLGSVSLAGWPLAMAYDARYGTAAAVRSLLPRKAA